MIKEKQKKIIRLAVLAGEIMMKSGAEVYRVEDTIWRICKACDVNDVEVFAIPTGIFLSMDHGENGEMYSYIRRIKGISTDLTKISETNQFSRDFVNTSLTIEEGMDWLGNIQAKKPYKLWIRTLSAAFACAFFCLMFKGAIEDFFCAFVIGGLSYLISGIFDKLETHYFIKGFCCTAFATLLSVLCVALGLGNDSGPITIGALMLFVPGVAITNSIRDMLAGDMVSGVARMMEAFVIALSLSAGAGVIIKIWVLTGGVFI